MRNKRQEYKQVPQKNQMCLKMALLQDKACRVALSNTSYCLISDKQKQLSQLFSQGIAPMKPTQLNCCEN